MTPEELTALLKWADDLAANPAATLNLNPADPDESAVAAALAKAAQTLTALAQENLELREAHARLEKKIEALAIMGRDIVRYADQAVNYPKKHKAD